MSPVAGVETLDTSQLNSSLCLAANTAGAVSLRVNASCVGVAATLMLGTLAEDVIATTGGELVVMFDPDALAPGDGLLLVPRASRRDLLADAESSRRDAPSLASTEELDSSTRSVLLVETGYVVSVTVVLEYP